jgi:hypothetical protein
MGHKGCVAVGIDSQVRKLEELSRGLGRGWYELAVDPESLTRVRTRLFLKVPSEGPASLLCVASYSRSGDSGFLVGADPPAQNSYWKDHEEEQEKVQDGANPLGGAVPEEAIPDDIVIMPSPHFSLRNTCIVRRSF